MISILFNFLKLPSHFFVLLRNDWYTSLYNLTVYMMVCLHNCEMIVGSANIFSYRLSHSFFNSWAKIEVITKDFVDSMYRVFDAEQYILIFVH